MTGWNEAAVGAANGDWQLGEGEFTFIPLSVAFPMTSTLVNVALEGWVLDKPDADPRCPVTMATSSGDWRCRFAWDPERKTWWWKMLPREAKSGGIFQRVKALFK